MNTLIINNTLHKKYYFDPIKEYEMGEHVALMAEVRNAYSILIGIRRRKRQDNIHWILRK
jgi:hypothetical protein